MSNTHDFAKEHRMPSPTPTRHDDPSSPEQLVDSAPVASVPLLDVSREIAPLEDKILAAVTQVTRSARFVMGPECGQLEQRIADYCGVSHAIGCASGSDALLLSLMAIDLRPGEEVILPSFTFFATASAVWRLGGTPVFADIDQHTFNLDPEQVSDLVTSKTRAIIPVHLFGQAADMDVINAIAAEHDLTVIEDAAQAIGAQFEGRRAGALADIGCFSFYPTKNLGGFGDGGILTTNSDVLAEKLRLLRVHGMKPRYHHAVVGVNSRLDTIQAAVLNVKLPNLPAWTAARQENARRYQQLFQEATLTDYIDLPQEMSRRTHVWNQYTIRVRAGLRDELRKYLADQGVGTEIYYPIPLHQQACFQTLGQQKPLPETERAAREVLSLPIFPTMTAAEQNAVVIRVSEFFAEQKKPAGLAVPHVRPHSAAGQSLQSL